MDSTVLDTVISSMSDQLINLVSKAGVAIAAVVGIGLTIFGAKWLFGVVKEFFLKLSGEFGGEYEDSYEYYSSGQYKRDYDYDIDS